jgi:hypothetical protein
MICRFRYDKSKYQRSANAYQTRVCESVRVVREYEKYVDYATCGNSKYVLNKFGVNPSTNERTLYHVRARILALAHVRTVREHEHYVAHAICGAP